MLDKYRVEYLLGAGGMGEVYRALDTTSGGVVALKVLHTKLLTDRVSRARFDREAGALAQVKHHGIVALLGRGYTTTGEPFLVFEHLDGETLQGRLDRLRMSALETLGVMTQVTEALTAAHDRRIVHRDLKPSNIFITTDGRVKLLDFGLVKQVRAADDLGPTESKLTREGEGAGTPAYMSPEQLNGEDAGSPSDIFSLGVVLHYAVAGEHPFSGPTTAATCGAILHVTPPSLDQLLPELPDGLARLVKRCLKKNPRSRYATARQLNAELVRVTALATASEKSAAPEPERGASAEPDPSSSTRWPAFGWWLLIASALLAAAYLTFSRMPLP